MMCSCSGQKNPAAPRTTNSGATGKADLPKRRAELAVEEENLRRLAAELEWQADDIDQLVARIPTKPSGACSRHS